MDKGRASTPRSRRFPYAFESGLVASQHRLLLGAITLTALALRCWGIRWGAPARLDLHPDEIEYVMKHALEMMERIRAALGHSGGFDSTTLDPVFLNYPGFLKYLIAFASLACERLGVVTESWHVYVVGRVIVAAFGAATVPVVYRLTLELGATRVGALLAASWIALLPLHVWESHVAVTDVPMTFWITLMLLAAVRLLRTGEVRDYAFAGAALGFAVASKYTAAIFLLAIPIAALASRRPLLDTSKKLIGCGLLSVACCFVVTPYSFLRFEDLLAAMAFEHEHVTSGHWGFNADGSGWQFRRGVYQVAAAWPFSLGFALYSSCIAGTAWVLVHLNRRTLPVVGASAAFAAVTMSWLFTPLRYSMPLLVVGVAFAGLWHGRWLASPLAWQRRAATTIVAVTLAYTGVFVMQTTSRYTRDTRVEAARWLAESVPQGASILLAGSKPFVALPPDRGRFRLHFDHDRAVADLDRREPYDLIQISSLLYQRFYRAGDEAYVAAYDRLRDPAGRFELVARFESRFIHEDLYTRLDPMFEGYFLSPTLEFYRPKAGRGVEQRAPA